MEFLKILVFKSVMKNINMFAYKGTFSLFTSWHISEHITGILKFQIPLQYQMPTLNEQRFNSILHHLYKY